jgi:hypothetical protein
MRIFIWHGYLLGGTGSNIYTRQLAREWGLEGHEVTVFSQEPAPERFDLGGAATVKPDVGGLLPVFVIDRYEGWRGEAAAGLLARGARWVEANAAAIREHGPADRVVNHVPGGAVGAASGGGYVVKAHGPSPDFDARQPGAVGGAGGARGRPGDDRRLRTSATSSGRSAGGRRRPRDPAGRRRRALAPAPREQALEQLLAESRLDAPNPGNAEERLPDGGNAERLAASWRATARPSSTGKLIENKGVRSCSRRCAARRPCRDRRFHDYRRARAAGGARRAFTGPEHRHLVHLPALADAVVVPSIFPEASAWSPPRRRQPAARRSSPTTSAWPRSPADSTRLPVAPRRSGELPER